MPPPPVLPASHARHQEEADAAARSRSSSRSRVELAFLRRALGGKSAATTAVGMRPAREFSERAWAGEVDWPPVYVRTGATGEALLRSVSLPTSEAPAVRLPSLLDYSDPSLCRDQRVGSMSPPGGGGAAGGHTRSLPVKRRRGPSLLGLLARFAGAPLEQRQRRSALSALTALTSRRPSLDSEVEWGEEDDDDDEKEEGISLQRRSGGQWSSFSSPLPPILDARQRCTGRELTALHLAIEARGSSSISNSSNSINSSSNSGVLKGGGGVIVGKKKRKSGEELSRPFVWSLFRAAARTSGVRLLSVCCV